MNYKKALALITICFISFIDIMGIGLVYPMFASMLFQGDCLMLPADSSDSFRGVCLGVLLSTMPLTQFFSAPILGMLSDKKGRRKVLIPSLAVGILGYTLAVIAVSYDNFALLLLSRIAVGISAGTAAVVGAALADISTPEEKTKNFGLFNMAGGLGFAIGPFLGGVLSGTSFLFIKGYALPFVMAGSVTLLNLLLVYFFLHESYVPKVVEKLNFFQGVRNIVKAFQIPGLRTIFLSVFLACVGWSFYWEFTPVTWIDKFDFSTATIGNFYAYGAAVYAISCGVLIRPIVDRVSNDRLLCYSLIGVGFSIGLLLINTHEMWLWVYIPLQNFFMALFWPTAGATVSNSVSEDIQGEILGVFQSVDALAFAVSPLIAGPLLGISAMMPIIVGCSCILLAAIVINIYRKNQVPILKKF